jgi:hypothetical protein
LKVFVKINNVEVDESKPDWKFTARIEPETCGRVTGEIFNRPFERLIYGIDDRDSQAEETCLSLVVCAILSAFHEPSIS